MARKLNFSKKFTKKLDLKASDNEYITTIEVAATADEAGAPMFHICCDNEEIFENPNAFQFSFDSFLKAVAEEYLDGHYSHPFHLVRSYKQLASVLRHYANLMELKAEEHQSQAMEYEESVE